MLQFISWSAAIGVTMWHTLTECPVVLNLFHNPPTKPAFACTQLLYGTTHKHASRYSQAKHIIVKGTQTSIMKQPKK